MNRISQLAKGGLMRLGPRFLPFADVATRELPLSRLLRLSLFQVSVGMALVLLIGTLNRVMIVELGVPASLVGIMISLPLIFAPFRAVIGFKSDIHRSALGWRRVPFIWKGTMLQFGGLAMMPFALLVLSGGGNAAHAPVWIGQLGAGIAFLLVGAGLHTVQTVGLALATDLAPVEAQPKVVGLMYVSLLVGMIASAFAFGAALTEFSPARLIQVIQASAILTLVLNITAVWKQEARHSAPRDVRQAATFRQSWEQFLAGSSALRRLSVVGVGTMGFGMADVLLEPYGGQVLNLSVADTTKLTAALAAGGLVGFAYASRVLGRGADPIRMAATGVLVGIPGFALVIGSAPLVSAAAFAIGTILVGFGAGVFGHGTLTATMSQAPKGQAGLALGAWGAIQASAAGIAIASGGIVRDVVASLPDSLLGGHKGAYLVVYGAELILLVLTVAVLWPMLRRSKGQSAPTPGTAPFREGLRAP